MVETIPLVRILDAYRSREDVILNAFGKLEIRTSRGTVDEESLVVARVWKLIMFLLIKGTRVSTQDIITNLWPDEDPDKASSNIRSSLYRFRQKTAFILEDNIVISRSNGYMLNPGVHRRIYSHSLIRSLRTISS